MTATRNLQAIAPVAPSQLGMLVETLASGENGVHVEQLSWPLRGPLDPELLEAAWAQVIADSEVLRTGFVLRDCADPLQYVVRDARSPLEVHDLTGLAGGEQTAAVERFLVAHRERDFALDRPPLLRLALLRCAADRHQFVWTFHHIILDGWSVPLLAMRAFAVYEALARREPPPAWGPRPYRDFVAWLGEQPAEDAGRFWAGRLTGVPLPTPLGRPSSRPPAGAGHGTLEVRVDADTMARLERARRAHGVTLATVLQGAWALLLGHYGGAARVVFGATVAGRPPQFAGVETMVGLFINTIPISIELPREGPLWSWLAQEQQRRAEERTFEHCAPAQIHEALALPGATPLFESILVFENYPMPGDGELQGSVTIGVPSIRTNGSYTHFPLTIIATPGETLELRLVHRRRRLSADDAAIVGEGFQRLLRELARRPDPDLRELGDWLAGRPRPSCHSGSVARRNSTRAQPAVGRALDDEALLAALWQELLETESPPGVDDDFFDAGGHSLLALRMSQEIGRRFGCELALADVFEARTIRGLAELLATARGGGGPAVARAPLPAPLTTLRPGSNARPLFLAPPGAGTPVSYRAVAAAIATEQAVYGFQTPGLEPGERPLDSVEEIARHLVACMRDVQPEGPYRLGGWSFGAMIAWEAARLLQSEGETVERLILIDAGARDVRSRQDPLRRAWSDGAALAGIARGAGIPRSWGDVRMLAQLVGVGLPDSPLQIGPRELGAGRRSLGSWLANVNASRGYEPRPLDGEVVLMRANDSWPGFPDPLQEDLGGLTGNRVRVVSVPGNHMTMVLEPDKAAQLGGAVGQTIAGGEGQGSDPKVAPRTASTTQEEEAMQGDEAMQDDVRIVALDGTEAVGGTGWVAAALLKELYRQMEPERQARFLNRTTIFAGTSAGSANALFLAMAPDPDTALAYIAGFWRESSAIASRGVSPLGFARAVVGLGSILSTKKLRSFYLHHFGMAKLGDLPHKVVIPSFRLNVPADPNARWRPKVFNNIDPNNPDMDELVVDVLMRSSSPPLLTPVYQALNNEGPGYVDGGVWANNPSMAAIAQVMHHRGHGSADGIRVLSVGNGSDPLRMEPHFKDGFGSVGYIGWLLNARNPGALLSLVITAGEAGTCYEADALLRERFHHIDPVLPGRVLEFTADGIDRAVAQIMQYENTRAQISQTLAWLADVDWYGAG